MELTRHDLGDEAPELHRRALAGDTEARNRVVEANLALVGWFAEKFARHYPHLELADVVAWASAGLVRAAAKHDPARGTRFATTAYQWMRHSVSHANARAAAWMAEPRDFMTMGRRYFDARSERHRAKTAMLASGPRRPRGLAAADRGSLVWGGRGPAEEAEAAEAASEAEALPWGELTDREREVMRKRYGLDGPERTNAELARELGLSRERVRQLLANAAAKLRGGAA